MSGRNSRGSWPAKGMRARVRWGLALAAAVSLAACGDPASPAAPALDEVPQRPPGVPRASDLVRSEGVLPENALAHALSMSPVPEPPPDPTNAWAEDPAAAAFGRALFYAESLSKAGDTSCATCHSPEASLADDRTLGYGVTDLERHTIALWNVAHQRWLFWDGRADSLWSQALVPFEDPLEHAFARTEIARTVARDPGLRELYEAAFGELPADFTDTERFPPYARPVPEDDRAHLRARAHAEQARAAAGASKSEHQHRGGTSGFYHPHQRAWDQMAEADRTLVNGVFVRVGKSIAAFERGFRSTRSDFDVFVEGLRAGDASRIEALSDDARRGFELFVGKARCVSCHGGPLFTDLEFHDTRVPIVDGARSDDPGRAEGIARVLASEFGVRSQWSDAREGNPVAKVEFLPRPGVDGHSHGFVPEFKTPSLRNVSETGPYMHNGAFETLEEVVEFYDKRENLRPSSVPGERILEPLGLTPDERSDLVAFLESLTDDYLDMGRVGPPER